MKNLIYNLISKWPVKVMLIIGIFIIGIVYFVSQITLSTGNETLIQTDTDTYQSNYQYQKTFGTDPVIIVFEGENQESLLSFDSLIIVNELVKSLEKEDGIFYINSPIGIIDYATMMGYNQTKLALNDIGLGLITMSENMSNMSLSNEDIDPETLITTFENLSTAQEEISTNASNQSDALGTMQTAVDDEITRLDDIKTTLDPVLDETRIQSITQTTQILNNIYDLYDQLILFNDTLATGATQTSTALSQISTELDTMFQTISTVEGNIDSLVVNLETMGTSMTTLAANFDMFTNAFPSTSETLEKVVYPEGTINPMIETYMIDDTHMYMSIILEESVTNDDIESILNVIELELSDTVHKDALVSGKPVLDYDIQSSMMESMRVMMMTAGIIMIVILLILFPVPARLLPLLIVLLAVVTTIGIMGLFSIPLTMVSMAVFPVLIGLGIDYSIQFHNRYIEETNGGVSNE